MAGKIACCKYLNDYFQVCLAKSNFAQRIGIVLLAYCYIFCGEPNTNT